MKRIKYQFLTANVTLGSETERIFVEKGMPYSEANEEIARKEAYNGEYTVYDDGQPEPETSSGDAVTWDALDAAYREGVDSL